MSDQENLRIIREVYAVWEQGETPPELEALLSDIDLRFEPTEFVARGNKVIVFGSYHSNINSSHQEDEGSCAHVFTLQDEKIVGFHEYTDSSSLRMFLPDPPPRVA